MPEDLKEEELFGGKGVIKFANPVDRRRFLRYAGMVGVGSSLALVGVACGGDEDSGGAVGGGETDPTSDPSPSESADPAASADLGILNYALTLEYLEADFYKQGLAGTILTGREKELIDPILAHEQAHVDALTATVTQVGGTPAALPTFQYPDGTFTDKASFLKTASVFEELGVNAYHGQVTLIQSPEILGAAASIAGVESRHAAIIATLIGGKPFPAPVETTKTMDEVLVAVKPFIKA